MVRVVMAVDAIKHLDRDAETASGYREGLIRPVSIAIAPFKLGIVTPN
jgi:hypothetical protein